MKRGFPQFVTMCSLSGIYFYKSQCHNCRRNFAITCLLGLFAGFAQAMPFVNLAHPDEILLDDRPTDRVTVAADGTVTLAGGEASFIRLTWKVSLPKDAKIYGSQWERTYGRMAWRRVDDGDKPYGGALNWYVLLSDGRRTDGYGVKVQPNAFASWRASGDRLELLLDVRAGSSPVLLGDRRLAAAQLVSRKGLGKETAFAAARAFCRVMCPRPRLAKEPVFGFNDWFCRYGRKTATNFLADVRHYVTAFDRLGPSANRPYAVVDAGWSLRDGRWDAHNGGWGMPMAQVAAELKAMNARAGLWYRPLYAYRTVPDGWRALGTTEKDFLIDPTVPEVADAAERDLRCFRGWGFALVKIDFLTLDWGGNLGGEKIMKDSRVQWRDRSRTSAEVVLGLYRRMREAAGDMVIIGCNAIDHFAAGLFELQRTGQDVSGVGWEWTRRYGVNTLGQRAHHNGIFYQSDPDCVCLTREGSLPWGFNRQWLDAVARSGESLFVSWPRALAPDGSAALASIAKAWYLAARTTETAEPLDWETELWPRQWRFADGRRIDFDWCLAENERAACGTAPLQPSEGRRSLRLAAGDWTADVDWTGRIRLLRKGQVLGEVAPLVAVGGQRRERPMTWEFLRHGDAVVCRNDYEGGLKVISTVSLAANGEVKVGQECAICIGWGLVSGRVGVDCGNERAQDVKLKGNRERRHFKWTLTPTDFKQRKQAEINRQDVRRVDYLSENRVYCLRCERKES